MIRNFCRAIAKLIQGNIRIDACPRVNFVVKLTALCFLDLYFMITVMMQVILSQTDVVKPRAVDINDNVQLSDEVREQCNVAEERVREARPLEQVCIVLE